MEQESNKVSVRAKKWLVSLAFLLFSVLILGGFYLFNTPGDTANMAFAYVVGLSMIVLPCTLPLAFVIVPLAMGKSPKKGLLMSLFFGLGLAITLSLYGLFVAIIGKSIGLDQAIGSAGAVSRILFIVGGLAAFIFGLSELNLIKFKIPTYGGSYPEFITKQGDYLKAFFLGLFLGNAGVGCPNPLFYVLLGDIAVLGDVANGWWLGFVHGVGRATPLIFLTILGILGVNAVGNIAKKTAVVKKWTSVTLILLGAFIFISGTSHQWYEESAVHVGWNNAISYVVGDKSGIVEKGAIENNVVSDISSTSPVNATQNDNSGNNGEELKDIIPAPWSWITLLALIIVPLWWYWRKEKKLKIEDDINN
jgi:cytochrome c-type biogenesis protein